MAKLLCGAMFGFGLALTIVSGSALADDTGFASAHDLRKERGRTCMSDHYHQGGGSGSTKKAAQVDAIKSWQNFTAFEYGSDWARFSKAASKSMSCSASTSGVECNVEARACR